MSLQSFVDDLYAVISQIHHLLKRTTDEKQIRDYGQKLEYIQHQVVPVIEHVRLWDMRGNMNYYGNFTNRVEEVMELWTDWQNEKESVKEMQKDAETFRILKEQLKELFSNKTELSEREKKICELMGWEEFVHDSRSEQCKVLPDPLNVEINAVLNNIRNHVNQGLQNFDVKNAMNETQRLFVENQYLVDQVMNALHVPVDVYDMFATRATKATRDKTPNVDDDDDDDDDDDEQEPEEDFDTFSEFTNMSGLSDE